MMETVKYESPRFEFEEMRLMERVADTCWGYAYAWFDADGDKYIDEHEKVKLSDLGLNEHGCQGAAAREALKEYWREIPGVDPKKLDSAVATSNDSPYVVKSNS